MQPSDDDMLTEPIPSEKAPMFPVIQSAWPAIEAELQSALRSGAMLEDLGVFVLDLRVPSRGDGPPRAEVMWRTELRSLAGRLDDSFSKTLCTPAPPGCIWVVVMQPDAVVLASVEWAHVRRFENAS